MLQNKQNVNVSVYGAIPNGMSCYFITNCFADAVLFWLVLSERVFAVPQQPDDSYAETEIQQVKKAFDVWF